MVPSLSTFRSALLAVTLAASQAAHAAAPEPMRIVLLNGRSIPITSVQLQAENLIVTTAFESFAKDQIIPFAIADHVFGPQPAELKQAVAQLLTGQAKEARKLVEPLVSQHRITAKIPGNYWIASARTLLLASAVMGDAAKCTEIGKELSEVTSSKGSDPFVALGRALLLPAATKAEERKIALSDLTNANSLQAEVCAYAAFYLGNLHREAKRNDKALEAYLSVPCLYPSGGLVILAAAEIQAAELLSALSRPLEAVALLNSAVRDAAGTPLVDEAAKLLKSLE
jgi:predicted Zn-dependent protease